MWLRFGFFCKSYKQDAPMNLISDFVRYPIFISSSHRFLILSIYLSSFIPHSSLLIPHSSFLNSSIPQFLIISSLIYQQVAPNGAQRIFSYCLSTNRSHLTALFYLSSLISYLSFINSSVHQFLTPHSSLLIPQFLISSIPHLIISSIHHLINLSLIQLATNHFNYLTNINQYFTPDFISYCT